MSSCFRAGRNVLSNAAHLVRLSVGSKISTCAGVGQSGGLEPGSIASIRGIGLRHGVSSGSGVGSVVFGLWWVVLAFGVCGIRCDQRARVRLETHESPSV